VTDTSTLHVYVANDPDLPKLFYVEEDEVWAAFEDAPELKERLRVTLGGLGDDILEAAETADVMLGWRFRHEDVIPRAKRLRWIHILGAGVEHLTPIDWLPEGVVLTNSSGVHTQRSGEYIACALLMLNSRIPQHVTRQRENVWDNRYSDTIDGKTVVVVGLGSIGGNAARRAKELGLNVRGVRRSADGHPHVDQMFTQDRLHDALSGADYLVVAAASTTETRGMIGAKELDLLNEDGGVINVARQDIMDYDALAERLESGRLRGAVLDVFDPEPLPSDSPLWDVDNLIVTPHVSSDPANYNETMLAIFRENVRRLLAGEELLNRVNPDRGY
jgi:phosphoglycerate dehydrogenase-like enzyme